MSSPTQQTALDVVSTFFTSKERHDLDATMALFAEDCEYVFPLSASGGQEPWFVYGTKAETTTYQRGVLERFSRIRMRDLELTASVDGDRVFATSFGDYAEHDGTPYTNVYVFRFLLRDGQITRVDEYANPVTYAKLAGLPLG